MDNNHTSFGVQQSLLRISSGITTLSDHAAPAAKQYQKAPFSLYITKI